MAHVLFPSATIFRCGMRFVIKQSKSVSPKSNREIHREEKRVESR